LRNGTINGSETEKITESDEKLSIKTTNRGETSPVEILEQKKMEKLLTL